MMERSYSGMNSAYYVGIQSVHHYDPEDHLDSLKKRFDDSESPTSGSSSNTATQMTTMGHESEAVAQELMSTVQRQAVATQGLMGPKTHQGSLPQLDRPLPIRKRQRKPAKAPRVVEVEAESFPVASPNRRGRKPKAASKKAKSTSVAAAGGVQKVAAVATRVVVKTPSSPPVPRELPARCTPKRMWAEEEVEFGARRGRAAAAQARAEEEDYVEYIPVRRAKPQGPPRPRQGQEGRPLPAKGQKEGGPCAVCYATKSATWRRGAQGGRHAGKPLCNKCGVWEFRHPDSPPRDEAELERAGSSRRGSGCLGVARRSYDHPKALPDQPLPHANPTALATLPLPSQEALPVTTQAEVQRPLNISISRTTAVEAPATAAAAAPVSRMQPWVGNNLVARVPVAAQNSTGQWQDKSGFAHAANAVAESPFSFADGQSGLAGGSKMSRKRSADATEAEPRAKRWQIESFPGSVAHGGVTGMATAARLSEGGSSSNENGQEGIQWAEGLMGAHFKDTSLRVKVALSNAAIDQATEEMDECGHM